MDSVITRRQSMKKLNPLANRRFSLTGVQTVPVVTEGDFRLELLCFEAGQSITNLQHTGTAVYQVIEGEAIVRSGNGREDVGSGRLLTVNSGLEHSIENAG